MGQGRDRNSPFTWDTKVSTNTSRGEDMESDQEPTVPPITRRGMAEGKRVEVSMQRHPNGADSARPKHGMLARREYGFMAPEEPENPAGDPAATGPQGSGDNPEYTTGTGGTDERETGMGE